jgi:hypothetical protein
VELSDFRFFEVSFVYFPFISHKSLQAKLELCAIKVPPNIFRFIEQHFSAYCKVQNAGVLVSGCEVQSLQWQKSQGPILRAPSLLMWLVTAQTLMIGLPNWDVRRVCVRDH